MRHLIFFLLFSSFLFANAQVRNRYSVSLPGTGSASSVSAGETSLSCNCTANGTTDNTDSINAAIQRAKAQGKTAVLLPAGTMIVSSVYDVAATWKPTGIKLESGITLKGKGMDVTILKLANNPAGVTFSSTTGNGADYISYNNTGDSFNSVIHGDTTTRAGVEDLTVDGNFANQTGWNVTAYNPFPDINGILFTGGSDNVVRNVKVKDCVAGGVFLRRAKRSLVEKCYLSGSGFGGVVSYGDATGTVIRNNVATLSQCDNIRVARTDAVEISGNECSYAQQNAGVSFNYAGIYVEDCNNIRILNNYCHNNSAYGIDVAQGSLQQNALFGTIISGNIVTYNRNGGLQNAAGNTLIVGNQVINNGKDAAGVSDAKGYNPYGVVIAPGAKGINATGNTFRDTRGYQTYALSGASTTNTGIFFTGNFVYGHTAVYDSTKFAAVSNNIQGNIRMTSGGVVSTY